VTIDARADRLAALLADGERLGAISPQMRAEFTKELRELFAAFGTVVGTCDAALRTAGQRIEDLERQLGGGLLPRGANTDRPTQRLPELFAKLVCGEANGQIQGGLSVEIQTWLGQFARELALELAENRKATEFLLNRVKQLEALTVSLQFARRN
jgi:hypothetical protein